MSKITAARIDNDEQRLEILPTFFGADFLRVEMALYSHLQKMCEEYNGAYWYMYKLSNGAMYLAPAIENRKLRLTVDTNGYSGEVSGDAAGLITCLFVFNALCWKYPSARTSWTCSTSCVTSPSTTRRLRKSSPPSTDQPLGAEPIRPELPRKGAKP
ncbi:hypothetical protein 38_00074 [Pseudomonas phage Epa38]|nr:hypothetical protein 38_00074 [Pseudomonas phage Epa38]